jgi:hypothetical protein
MRESMQIDWEKTLFIARMLNRHDPNHCQRTVHGVETVVQPDAAERGHDV